MLFSLLQVVTLMNWTAHWKTVVSRFCLHSLYVLWVALNTSVCPDPGGGCEIHMRACTLFAFEWVITCVLCRGRPAVAGVVNLHLPHPQRSKLAMSRVPSPPPPAEMTSGPVAESWCYTQVSECVCVCVCVCARFLVSRWIFILLDRGAQFWWSTFRFRSMSNQTHLNQPIKLLGFTWKWLAGVLEQDWN